MAQTAKIMQLMKGFTIEEAAEYILKDMPKELQTLGYSLSTFKPDVKRDLTYSLEHMDPDDRAKLLEQLSDADDSHSEYAANFSTPLPQLVNRYSTNQSLWKNLLAGLTTKWERIINKEDIRENT